MNQIEKMLQTDGTVIIDVRTRGEFMGGHVAGSLNIPLNELPGHIDDLKSMKNIIVCCASGMRSQSAASLLTQHGISCINGGPWVNVNFYANKN